MANIVVQVDGRAFMSPTQFALWVRDTLNALVKQNRILLARKVVPPLYRSGVRYQVEPYESFVCAATCYQRGVGDCAHLAAWRCAELQNAGEQASIRISWRPSKAIKDKMIYHVQVRRGDKRIEDPSKLLGMP